METPLHGAIFICLTMLVSAAGLLLVRRYVDIDWLKLHHDVASYFFLTIGTVYAVLIAFAVFVVWSQFRDAGSNLEHEVNEVADLSRMSLAMPQPLRADIREALLEYIHAVLEDEFPAMQQGRQSERTWQAIQKIWDVYNHAEPAGAKLGAYYAESLRHLNALCDYRRIRIFTSRGTVPAMLWYLLLFGGGCLIVFTYFFGHESVISQAIMTAALAGFLAFSWFLIYAYDSPFAGTARVRPDPYRLELQHITQRH